MYSLARFGSTTQKEVPVFARGIPVRNSWYCIADSKRTIYNPVLRARNYKVGKSSQANHILAFLHFCILYLFIMKFFGGDSDSNKKEKQDPNGSNGIPGAVAVAPQCEDDIPLITDAVVVHDEPRYSKPPPVNPDWMKAAKQPAGAPGNQMMVPSQPIAPANNTAVPYRPGHLVRPTPMYHNLGRNPVGLQCPHCGRQTVTVVQDRMGLGTLIAVLALAIFFWPLCWLPLCIPSCKVTYHYCGHAECRRRVGETSPCA